MIRGISTRFLIFCASSYISAAGRKRRKGTATLCQFEISPTRKRAGSPLLYVIYIPSFLSETYPSRELQSRRRQFRYLGCVLLAVLLPPTQWIREVAPSAGQTVPAG